jgi:CheY-like chemotaxis protein
MTHDSRRGTILVADDNLDILGFARVFLEIAGYTVITAADGEEALRFYEKYRSSIVLLLTDVVMPNINGIELADRVRGMDAELPVLLMSGQAGCDHPGLECVAKPFRPAELIETVSRMLYAPAQLKTTISAA